MLVKTTLRLLVILFLGLPLSCASVLSGNQQEVSIASDVEGVEVYLNEEFLGSTPLRTTLARKSGQILIFRKVGYQTVKAALKTKITPEFWWNVPFTVLGTTGMSTDYGNGAVYQISPARMIIKMKPVDVKSRNLDESEDIQLFELFGGSELEKERARHQQGLWSQTAGHLENLEAGDFDFDLETP